MIGDALVTLQGISPSILSSGVLLFALTVLLWVTVWWCVQLSCEEHGLTSRNGSAYLD